MKVNYLSKILNARVYEVAKETPLEVAAKLSARLNNTVLLKREDQQAVFSFKLRGAYNKMAQLTAAEAARGVIAASAGNHAQGVALSATKLGITATIVMPTTTPQIKIDAVKARGAAVILHGVSFSESNTFAIALAKKQRATYVHPFDDPDVIAGQGTIGMEILRQLPRECDAVFIAVGGGGLIAGIGAYIKAVRPGVKIIGVEPFDSDAMTQSLKAKKRIKLDTVGLFADGVAVQLVGEETFRVAQTVVDEMVLCDTDAMCAAIKDVFEDTRSILEPAGALAVAGLKQYVAKHKWTGKTCVAIACGANMNFDRLRFVAERAEVGEAREALFAVSIDEKPGSFKAFIDVLGARNITEFNYRMANPKTAQVFVGIGVSGKPERLIVGKAIKKAGLKVLDLTEDEMAKLHIRHLVGGHSANASNERLFRFEFPERPGALMRFLTALNQGWNISLFHYRNHGADTGRVLVGLQIPDAEQSRVPVFLKKLDYPWVEETHNPAYQLFLGKLT
jgi:threonine dehydratase